MAGKKKEINKDSCFQIRFREQYNKNPKTLEVLAAEFNASRQTVSNWIIGKSIPDIQSLVRIAQFYNVSTDYLLGLSDTESVDANLRAAVEYTGLSAKAVERIHTGLDDFSCDGAGITDEIRHCNLRVASAFIQSESFTKLINNLGDVALEAYLERILMILHTRYSNCNFPEDNLDFRYANKDERDIVATNLIHVLQTKAPYDAELIPDKVLTMDDNALCTNVITALWRAEEANELHQFHAAKALNSYIDELISEYRRKAEQRFKK